MEYYRDEEYLRPVVLDNSFVYLHVDEVQAQLNVHQDRSEIEKSTMKVYQSK